MSEKRLCDDCDVDLVVKFIQGCKDPAKLSLIVRAAGDRLHELEHQDAIGAGQCTRDTARHYDVKIPGHDGPLP
jgi:polyphosphate kinase